MPSTILALMSHFSEYFLERCSCKTTAAASNFFASLSPFCLVTLIRAIFKRHPMEPEIKATLSRTAKINSECVRSDLWRKSLPIFAGDQICRDQRMKIAWCVAD